MAKNDIERIVAERERNRPSIGPRDPRFRPLDEQRTTVPAWIASKMPTGATRDLVRMAAHGLGQTGTTLLRFLDIPNRVFGNTRSRLQDIYESAERNMARDEFEDKSGVPQVGATAVHLASMGVAGRALPAVFGANVGADTYETAKYAGAPEGEALAKGVGHGVVDTAIWTLGQGLASKYLPKAWQWLGREITGAGRGAASSVTSDAVLNSLGADISGEEMAKRAVHAAWMVPLLGMLKMGGKRREEAMSLLRKARPDLAGGKADKVIETIEAEFADPKSQKVALAWVARKGANLPDDTAQIRQALEVSSKVKGLDPMSRSPFEILSDPAYARYLPKPRPQDVKAFSNMKRYPMGVIGFDVSDDAAGRQATREMINAYMSPSSNPWCLATGSGAAKLGELGPGAESYWKQHSAVPKQIFFQEVDGKLELTAFRATGPGGEGRQEYWDTSDAGYSGIPIKVKVPGDPMGRYRKMVFRPAADIIAQSRTIEDDVRRSAPSMNTLRRYLPEHLRDASVHTLAEDYPEVLEDARSRYDAETRQRLERERLLATKPPEEVQGTFEDIAPGKLFKGDPFRDGRSQTWVVPQKAVNTLFRNAGEVDVFTMDDIIRESPRMSMRTFRRRFPRMTEVYGLSDASTVAEARDMVYTKVHAPHQIGEYVLVEDKERTTENGITKFRTTKYVDPTDPDLGLYEGDENLKIGQPVEIEESELVSPEWMRSRGYDPESESDVRRMQQDLDIQAWGNGMEAAMAVVPTKRTYLQTKSGTPETVTYGPNGRDVVSVDFEENGVPYRAEVAESGVHGAIPRILGSVTDGLGLDRQTLVRPSIRTGWGDFSGIGEFRLTRYPDSQSPEVVESAGWDEDLGGFVRTIGTRRWRMVELEPTEDEKEGARLYNRYVEAFKGVNFNEEPRTPRQRQDIILARKASDEYATWADQHPSLVSPAGIAYYRGGPLPPRLLAEARQPDGTWAPAVDVIPNANGGTTRLPSPPPAVGGPDLEDEIDALGPGAVSAEDYAIMQGRRIRGDDLVAFALKAGKTRRNVRTDTKGGDTGPAENESIPETDGELAPQGGPRIVINPQVFNDKRDALCVAFNEAFRVVMETNGFEPVSEPTEKQRKFFADTAYANDELQLRRTILARIATLDTSVKDPTDEQLEETAEMLEMVMEVGAPQNEWEQQAVQRLHDVVAKSLESTRANGTAQQPEPPKDEASTQADVGGGVPSLEERFEKPYLEEDAEAYKEAFKTVEKYETTLDIARKAGWRGDNLPLSQHEAWAYKTLAEINNRNMGLRRYWENQSKSGAFIRADDGTGVTDPAWAPKRLARQVKSGFTGFLAGAASALDGLLGARPQERQMRGETALNNSSWLTRTADDLAEYSERQRLSFPLPGETAVRTTAEWAPWLALPAPQYTIPAAAYGGTVSSTRRAYDAAWSATRVDPESAGWWMKPELRGAAVAGVAMLPMLPVGRQVGKMWDSVAGRVFPSAERAVVPYSPGWAYLQTARQAWSAEHGPLAVGAQIGTAVGTIPAMNYLAEPSEKTLFPLQSEK